MVGVLVQNKLTQYPKLRFDEDSKSIQNLVALIQILVE